MNMGLISVGDTGAHQLSGWYGCGTDRHAHLYTKPNQVTVTEAATLGTFPTLATDSQRKCHPVIMTSLLHAQASLSTLCSFSSELVPELTVSFTLQAPSAITTNKQTTPFWPIVNTIEITDAQTFEKVKLPRMDVCFRKGRSNEKANLLTLVPGVPYEDKLDFRPFGKQRFDRERLREMGSEKW